MPSSEGGRPRPAKTAERLRRMLIFVPYLVQHAGTKLSEVARLFDVNEDELTADLNLLFLSGLPPYGPGDLIDVDIEDGRVWIRMADYFARPVRLTRNEARDLYLRAVALAGAPGLAEAPALSGALRKLADALGPDALGPLAERVEAAGSSPAGTMLEAVRRAVADHRRVEIEYHAISSGEITVRRIDPEEVFLAIGNWYVAAWDDRSDQERLFRVDRIRRVTPTRGRFEPRGLAGAGRPLYTPTGEDVEVRLVLHPGARWVAEYYETTSEVDLPDGTLEIVLPAKRLEWVARLMLRLAGEARIVGPEVLKDRVRELVSRTLERYLLTSPDEPSDA